MNLAVSPIAANTLKMTLSLQTLDSGRILAAVLEIPDCRVEAETREAAIVEINHLLSKRFQYAEFVALELPVSRLSTPNHSELESPWTKLFGLFKDDPIFAEIAAEMQAEREIEDDTEVDPSVYLRECA
jgi:hypothetical protein